MGTRSALAAKWLGAFLAVLLIAGCGSYAHRVREARGFLESGQYDSAIEAYKKLAEKKDNDYLLYLMDMGVAYHAAGRYQDAIAVFLNAADETEIKDYTSVAEEVGAVILNDQIKPYKGEDFEKVLVHVYLAMDYTLLGKWDDALVECRKVNHILDMFIAKGNLPYENNAFAKYLAGSLFEARREYNSAFVDYRTLLKWSPDFPYLPAPLKRVADKLQATQELAEYKKRYPGEGYRLGKNEGEVIILVEQGKTPIKVEHPDFHLLPKFLRRPGISDHFALRDASTTAEGRSYTLFDIEATAIRDLDHRIAGIAAKKIGGVVAKQIIANQVAKQTKSEGLGLLTALFLHASDQADLRSWTTLPARLQLVRLTLPAGRRDLILDMVTIQGQKMSGVKRWDGVEIKPGQTVFLNHRAAD